MRKPCSSLCSRIWILLTFGSMVVNICGALCRICHIERKPSALWASLSFHYVHVPVFCAFFLLLMLHLWCVWTRGPPRLRINRRMFERDFISRKQLQNFDLAANLLKKTIYSRTARTWAKLILIPFAEVWDIDHWGFSCHTRTGCGWSTSSSCTF